MWNKVFISVEKELEPLHTVHKVAWKVAEEYSAGHITVGY